MTAQPAAERARVVVSNDARSIVYSPVSRTLNRHVLSCPSCRDGSLELPLLCAVADRLLDDLLSASMPREDEPTWY